MNWSRNGAAGLWENDAVPISMRLFLWCLLAVCWADFGFSGQAAEEGSEQSRVSFGAAIGMAGQEISLPVYLSLAAGARIGQVAMVVTFTAPLTFLRAESAYPAEQVGAKVSADVAESKAQVEVSVPRDGKEGLPPGSTAFLVFKVSDSAPGGKLDVVADPVAMKDLNGQSIRAAVRSVGQIDIIPKEMEPLFACHFYMH